MKSRLCLNSRKVQGVVERKFQPLFTIVILVLITYLLFNTDHGFSFTPGGSSHSLNSSKPVPTQITKISDIKTFWSLTRLGGGISVAIFAVFALGMFLIVYQVYEMFMDRIHGRRLLVVDYRNMGLKDFQNMLRRNPNNMTARLYSLLLTIYQSTGNTYGFHDEINNYLQLQQDRFATFKSRLSFLSDTAGALGLLGTVWGMFVTFFGGNLDSQRILNGMGLALVTTLIGLVVSIILNFCSTEVFSFFNKQLEMIAEKADEFRLRLMNLTPASAHNNKNSSGNSGGTQVKKSQIGGKTSGESEVYDYKLASKLRLEPLTPVQIDGYIGKPLPRPVTLQVVDRYGNKIPDVPVTFEISEGGGTLNHYYRMAVSKTDKKGVVRMQWTLGTLVGPQRLCAAIMNDPDSQIEFIALARPLLPDDLERMKNRAPKGMIY